MKNTIVFCMQANNEESYGKIANFICKRESKADMTTSEVHGITYKYYLKNDTNLARDWAKRIISDQKDFETIHEPHNIRNITDQFAVVYCICIDAESDIIDLNNLYLIKQYYTDLDIIILFPQCSDDKYYTVSQFLYSIRVNDNKFYEECYFDHKKQIKKMQCNDVFFSRNFTPLQVIDEANLKRLFQKCKNFIDIDYIKSVQTPLLDDAKENADLINGSTKMLCYSAKMVQILTSEQGIDILQKLDVLAYVLLCYVVGKDSRDFNLDLLQKCAVQMQQYSNAIRQLAENIVYHSKTGKGVIALRLHDKESSYIKTKYHAGNTTDRYLEIIVSDFCSDNAGGNIAENFIQNLKEEKDKTEFKNLKPREFFEHGCQSKIEEVWENFYKNPDNIGKHFGLRIFQSIVLECNGMFGAESHSGYTNNSGDCYCSYQPIIAENCMPGTRYHIVFPVDNMKQIVVRQDLSLDNGIGINRQIKNYLNYTTDDIILQYASILIPESQRQKNAYIRELAGCLEQELSKKTADIIYISLIDFEDNTGEIIAKALIIALFRLKRNLNIVFYQCSGNLKKTIFDTMRIFYRNAALEGMFYERKIQVILYSFDYEETVLDLSSAINTDNINAYIAHMKCIAPVDGYLNPEMENIDIEKGSSSYIPCDILHKVRINDKVQTIFEHYTESILQNSIQGKEFGCRLEHTHMRLGSTVHINRFYEAEILFGNCLFVSRFALLLVKDMQKDIEQVSKLTLYGYGTYSETVLVRIIEMLHNLYPDKDIDYIILEREEERRGFLHKDRIRYNQFFRSKEERAAHFSDRKVAIIVLINSTLKTHMRLINLFKEENCISTERNTQWLIKNYAVLLVGDKKETAYWKLQDDNTILPKENILPYPRYLIQVDGTYQEPLKCGQCFPDNPVAEVPLIEVNAASTIPNQAFGLQEDDSRKSIKLEYKWIQDEEQQMLCLKDEFIYSHIQRNENHFLYYFKTENICIKQKGKITKSLEKWKDKQKKFQGMQYHIIVSPMHFSNAGFVELVNSVVFNGNAILLRIDFDKEYRCNAYTKYSYLRNYIRQLNNMNTTGNSVHIHYVDDAIISGRTFHRAKTLMNTIMDVNDGENYSIKPKIFDKVFVLIDRNSSESRNQYVENEATDFYAFITVNISSLRNYGDSCVYCNLEKESKLLFDTASTKQTADYWAHCIQKFQLYLLEQYVEEHPVQDSEKQFRRLFCTHMAQTVLSPKYHGNDSIQALDLILKLINTDYEFREKDKFEYFLSYLKCISRPFLVFNKAVKEAVFDIMLILVEALIYQRTIRSVIKEVEKDKPYLKSRVLITQFNKLDKDILQQLNPLQKKDLAKLLMKQLTELKSNYIIRHERMETFFKYIQHDKSFESYYVTLIVRLVGASSDTNKSIWLDEQIMNNCFSHVPLDFRVWVLLENTRAFRDGIEKLYKQIYGEPQISARLKDDTNTRIDELIEEYDYNRTCQMFSDFKQKYGNELEDYLDSENCNAETEHTVAKRLERFLKSLPDLKTLNVSGIMKELNHSGHKWNKIYSFIHEQIEEEYEEIQHRSKQKSKVANFSNWIMSDVYQFGIFQEMLRKEGCLADGQLSADGEDMIICCIKILDLCRNNDLAVLEKVKILAMLLKVILKAQNVQFIIEDKADSNLEEWKNVIERRYNKIVDEMDGDNDKLKINIAYKKQYLVIMERAGGGDADTEISNTTEELIEQLESQNPQLHSYIISEKYGAVIWKLENHHRSIWINIENDQWKSGQPEQQLKIAVAVRKVMMFYQELSKKIFNPENDDYINEISHARKTLNIYTSNKAFTHTKEFSREMHYEQAKYYFGQKEEYETVKCNYPSYILQLLADINISKYYRHGLSADFYYDDRGIQNAATWDKFSELIRNGQEFRYCVGKKDAVILQLQVDSIDSAESVLCTNSDTSIREMNLLLFAIILNAAEQNRGKRQNSDGHTDPKRVLLKIYKEDGYLIIANECEEKVDVEEIQRKLHHVPISEDEGISLWSFNCYIKQRINSLILAKLKEIEEHLLQHQKYDGIEETGKWIRRLTEYEIQPQNEETAEGQIYFKVKLPIFMEKFIEKEI